MLRTLALSTLATGAAYAEPLPTVPSGLALEFQELLFPEDGEMFLSVTAKDLAQIEFDVADKDLAVICSEYALAIAKETGSNEITIRLSDQPLPFGEANPEIKQFMGIYDVSQGQCEWL